jgi:glucose 1-dehydrogenase
MERLKGKVALVTGASRGIGRGSALCLAEEGADVVVNYRTHADEAREVVAAIERMGRRALAIQADVAEREQVQAMFDTALQHFGRLDIAVSNAAFSIRQPILEADWDSAQRTIAVTQFGVFHVCQRAAQQMVAQGQGGKIVIISSMVAQFAYGAPVYSMAKAAINHLCTTLALEVAKHHINVNVISPGWTDTPGERAFFSEDELRAGGERIPWGRLGTARDIGRAVVFLASDDADYITGANLYIDGGYKVGLKLPG